MKQKSKFTEDCIIDSLIILMNKQDFDSITMDNLATKSGISRRTIYRYFDNKMDILKKHISVLIDAYMSYVSANLRNGKSIVENSFEFISMHFDFFRLAYKNNLLINIVEILENVIRQVVQFSKKDYFTSMDPGYINYYVAYTAGGCWRLLCNWIKEDKKQSPHEMYIMYQYITRDLHKRLE